MRPALTTVRALPWPLPALLAWSLAWAVFVLAGRAGLPMTAALALASLLGGALAGGLPDQRAPTGRWRRVLVASGFPLSALLTQGALLPGWAWLLPLAALAIAYPRRAWRDAPLFPTPPGALLALRELLALPQTPVLLDAGCGLGHGLAALHATWPHAQVRGIEYSWPLRLLAAWRSPFARVRQGDMWAASWQDCDLVYLFQRPESMARAWAKASAEMRPGSWLVSLEFPVPGVPATFSTDGRAGRVAHAYRVGEAGTATQSPARRADKCRTAPSASKRAGP